MIIQIYTPNDFVTIMNEPIFNQTNKAIKAFNESLYIFTASLSVSLSAYSI